MKRTDLATKTASIEWIGDNLFVGAKFRRLPDAPKHGSWPQIFEIIELQKEYYPGIEPEIEDVEMGYTERDYFPRIVIRDENGKVTAMWIGYPNKQYINGQEIQLYDRFMFYEQVL